MKKNKPEIRFKGFEEEWIKTALEDISSKVIDKNNTRTYETVFTNSAEFGIIDQKDYFDRNIANTDNIQGYYVVMPNDFVYNPRISTSAPVGPINRNKLSYAGVMSPLYYVFRFKEDKIDLSYLDYFFKSSSWHDYMFQNGNSGARSDRFSINDNVFVNLPIQHPKSEGEQRKIGILLSTLDKLIRKLELKLDKLRNIKQSLLNQMFTNIKNEGGYAVPQIRFKNYNDAWQMKKAADIFVSFKEKNYPKLPVLSANQELGMVVRNDIGFNVQNDHRNESGYKRVMPGQFVIHLRSFQGGFAHSEIEGITSPAYTIMGFKLSSEHYDGFWKYLLTSKDFIKSLETVTYGIRDGRSIGFEDFGMLMQTYPRREEQKQIAKLLTITDDYIKMNDAKLTKIRTMKQSLLQKMFA